MPVQDQRLIDAMANMREDEALRAAQQIFQSGEDPLRVLESSREAMDRR